MGIKKILLFFSIFTLFANNITVVHAGPISFIKKKLGLGPKLTSEQLKTKQEKKEARGKLKQDIKAEVATQREAENKERAQKYEKMGKAQKFMTKLTSPLAAIGRKITDWWRVRKTYNKYKTEEKIKIEPKEFELKELPKHKPETLKEILETRAQRTLEEQKAAAAKIEQSVTERRKSLPAKISPIQAEQQRRFSLPAKSRGEISPELKAEIEKAKQKKIAAGIAEAKEQSILPKEPFVKVEKPTTSEEIMAEREATQAKIKADLEKAGEKFTKPTLWERFKKTTKSGFQAIKNRFGKKPKEKIGEGWQEVEVPESLPPKKPLPLTPPELQRQQELEKMAREIEERGGQEEMAPAA
ncbi:MAG: hypothetical protein WC436_01450 [Candidatus Babeliales bacterium]